MRPRTLFFLYRRRLRVHAVQELLAGVGVAVAVALVFAATVSSGSIVDSTEQVVHLLTGPAQLQLRSREANGFEERLLSRVERIPGVEQTAPLLEEQVTIVGPGGRHAKVSLAGADLSLGILDGLAHTLPRQVLSSQGISLSSAVAQKLGVASAGHPTVTLDVRGGAYPLRVSAILDKSLVGPLSQAQVAVMPLTRLQQLANLPGRISRILVQAKPGRQSAVRHELHELAGGHLTVAPSDQDVRLLREALKPSDQASGLFAAISALLGFLFAFNAILLTVPERRREISELRLSGAPRAAIVQLVLFQAICLGLVASLVGLLGGYALAAGVFHQEPTYLAQTFTLGGGTVIGVAQVLLTLVGGLLVTCLASVVLLSDLGHGRILDVVHGGEGTHGSSLDARSLRRLALAAAGPLAFATAAFILWPTLALLASAMLALATVLVVPLVLAGALRLCGALIARRPSLTAAALALMALRSTTLRSLALVITGAVAIFGGVALGGGRGDLLRGIEENAREYVQAADIWVLNPGDMPGIDEIRRGDRVTQISRIPGVENVREFQSEFMRLDRRMVWVIARPPGVGLQVLDGQIVEGSMNRAIARLRSPGWIVASRQLAEEQHVGIGGKLRLSTPSGTVYMRLAALSTNFGWSAGAVLMGIGDYRHYWGTSTPTAIGVDITPGAEIAKVRGAIARTLGPHSGLEVLSARSRADRLDEIARSGLSQLGAISTLLLLAAIVALAAALGSSIWQRRATLAELGLQGARRAQLRSILTVECGLMLGSCALAGALGGVYGQVVIDGYLARVTGYPVAGAVGVGRALEILAIVIGGVLVAVAIPSVISARVSPTVALEE